MKRIGVMTFWNDNENYGQILQAYALQTILISLGYSACIIPYIRKEHEGSQDNSYKKQTFFDKILNILSNPRTYISYYNYKIKEFIYRRNIIGEDRKFDYFRRSRMNFYPTSYSSLKELNANPPICDIYLCGSDIVWSERVNDMAYFLGFGPKSIKRIAYAASFGGAQISEEYANKIAIYLQSFSFIGVREKSGVDICRIAGRVDAQWVPDPTLLLSKQDYLKLSSFPNHDKKYMLVYLLGYDLTIDKNAIFKFAKKKGLEVKYIANKGTFDNYKRIYPTIEEWIGYIADAQYVITNSFHCAVFCSILNTDYTFNRIKGTNIQWNERFDSLMNMLGQDKDFFCSLRNDTIQPEVWQNINKHLETLQSYKEVLIDI